MKMFTLLSIFLLMFWGNTMSSQTTNTTSATVEDVRVETKKLKKAMDTMRQGDPRIDLLLALKVNLSEPRRKKVDEAIQLMRIINLMPLLREQGFLWGD